jgi:type I restriction enzyme S subunit
MSWKFESFGSLFEYENKSKIKAGDGMLKGNHPFFTSSTEQSKYLDIYSYNKKSLIFGTGGNPSIHYCDIPFSVSTDCLVSFPKDTSLVLPKYVYYYISGNIHLLEKGFKGAGLKHISKTYINEIPIPLPPLHIQVQIANTLDKADALRRKDQELLGKYDRLARAIFYDMFGDPGTNEKSWEPIKLLQVYSKQKDGTKCGPFGSTLKKEEYQRSGIPVWVMDNIKNESFIPKNCLFITKEKYETLISYSVTAGDIIISRAGTVGKMCVIETEIPLSIISTNLIRLSLDNESINPHFFISMMKYFGTSVGRLKKGADGSFTHMNTGILNNLEFGLPPLILQEKYVSILNNLQRQCKLIQSEERGNLFKYLEKNLFS